MFHSEKGEASIPLWEKICILIVITISVSSLYAVIHSYMDTGKNSTEHLSLVSRNEWRAQTPIGPPTKLSRLPPPYVVISHTATTFCYTQVQCSLIVRIVQTYHIENRDWNDIGYNFLVGGDGNIYEGCGWDIEGAHTFSFNHKSIGIAFIGNFITAKPTEVQLEAAKKLLKFGVKNGKIAEDYKLLGHRQVVKTESPGEMLLNIIKTWDHWSPKP